MPKLHVKLKRFVNIGKLLRVVIPVCVEGGRIGQQATVRIAVRCAGDVLGKEGSLEGGRGWGVM